VLLVAERGAEVTVVDEHTGDAGTSFASSVTELLLGDEATVRHFAVQRWSAAVQELFFQRAVLGRNARLTTAHVALGGQIHKGWVESSIRGSGAFSEILGVVFGDGDQHFDIITLQDHIGDHSVSDLLIKSALKDRAQSAYYGLTRINRDARMSDANQEDRNLLLSDKAKAEADPVLEIMTSEVARCAHGASAGPVDPEQLFYLECRGLPRTEAEKLLVQGFLGQVLERIPLEDVRALAEQAVAAKLRG
jgi:Fe-S cluster assembly protein SufD